jgi:Dolichyl-phosphate-mannose-protein mannosyltransferase
VKRLFELLLVARLLFPFFDSPLNHLYSDPQRHWDNAAAFLHPDIMGSSDPYLYQVWLYVVRTLAGAQPATVLLACGLLCALMPLGWYRALRELLPRDRALFGAIVIALIPESIEMYSFFMNETLLMALLGVSFWLTLRAYRKHTLGAFTLACAAWTCAALTRTFAIPMALLSIGGLWLLQEQRASRLLAATAVALVLLIPAGLHAQRNLHFFAPFGNLYLNATYHDSGKHDIAVDYGMHGSFQFGSPSFYNPTYYPFSKWLTDRTGTASIRVNTLHGRADWKREQARIRTERAFPSWRQRWEEIQYLLFGMNWPNEGTETVLSAATAWSRWLWAPLILFVLWAACRRWFVGKAWLLPICSLGTLMVMLVQREGVIEARFREPLDAVLVASAVCAMYYRRPGRQDSAGQIDSRGTSTYLSQPTSQVLIRPPQIMQ